MHSNVTIKNVSWSHFSWATLYIFELVNVGIPDLVCRLTVENTSQRVINYSIRDGHGQYFCHQNRDRYRLPLTMNVSSLVVCLFNLIYITSISISIENY